MRTEDIKVHNGEKGQNEGNKEKKRKQEQISGGGEIFHTRPDQSCGTAPFPGGKAAGA